ncbi:MAG TPA: isoprenylcysteine carboxylmethyltransferase family protein [Chthoniobacterales bacterium]
MNAEEEQGRHGSPWRVTVLFLLYGVVHSLLASTIAKRKFIQVAGERARNGLYRPLYNAQAVAGLAAGTWAFLRLPDRLLYAVPRPWSWLLHVIQGGGITLLVRALKTTGLDQITGLGPLWAFVTGKPVQPESEAQGPPPVSLRRPQKQGPYAWVRHPENLAMLALIWGIPRMTVNRLTLALWTTLYAVIGSWHEDTRLQEAYGTAFARYRRTTPMLLPRLVRPRQGR